MKGFPILVCIAAVFLLAGGPAFIAFLQGNVSIFENPAQVSLSPGAAFFFGLGVLGLWFVWKVPESDAKLGRKRLYVGWSLVLAAWWGLELLLYFSWV